MNVLTLSITRPDDPRVPRLLEELSVRRPGDTPNEYILREPHERPWEHAKTDHQTRMEESSRADATSP
jgi:hypothetical protein